LTSLHTQSPAAAISKLAWRKSRHDGRTWAKPLKLDSQIRAARARALLEQGLPSLDGDPRTAALLIIRGPMGVDPEGLLLALMQRLLQEANLTLTQHPSAHNLPDKSWAAVRDGDGRWTGSVKLRMASLEDVTQLEAIARTVVIRLHGEKRRLEVHNAYH
jgi:hypothetical protein